MCQVTFSDTEYAGKRMQPRRERFLAEMDLLGAGVIHRG
jgi:IS5 family transposase